MGRGLGWQRGSAYCAARNKDGTGCGNKVPRGESGYIIRRYCHVHRHYKGEEAK